MRGLQTQVLPIPFYQKGRFCLCFDAIHTESHVSAPHPTDDLASGGSFFKMRVGKEAGKIFLPRLAN